MSATPRHLLAIALTTGFIMAAWVVLSLPLVAVFVIDRAFVLEDFFQLALRTAGFALGLSAVVIFPLAYALERQRRLALSVPLLLLLASGGWLAERIFTTREILATLYDWPGALFAFSVVLAFYCLVLWLGRSVQTRKSWVARGRF
jgi:hypothetical protein